MNASFKSIRTLFVAAALAPLVALGCVNTNSKTTSHDTAAAQPTASSAFSPEFDPPTEWTTARFRLEPLAPKHNDLDFAAAQGSRDHLQRTLQWGGWPSADAKPEDNHADLERHIGEFNRHEAYAYTVLSPDATRCLGCLYINPVGPKGNPTDPTRARVAFWVIESELQNNLDRALVIETLTMLSTRFPIERADFSIPVQNQRGIAMLASLGLTETEAPAPTHRVFTWTRAD